MITPAGVTAHALHLLGDIATHPDWFDPDSGEAYYRRARTLAEPRGMRPLVAHCYLSHGKLYRCAGRRGEAQGHLTNRDDNVPRDGDDILVGEGGGSARPNRC